MAAHINHRASSHADEDDYNADHVITGGASTYITDTAGIIYTVTDGIITAVDAPPSVGTVDFPRLMAYMPPPEQSDANKARYDYIVYMPTEVDANEIAAIRQINPDIKVLVYTLSHEVYAFPASGYDNAYNAETRTLSADWMMLKAGSTLTSAITTTASTYACSVDDGSKFTAGQCVVIGGTAATPFSGDSPLNRTAELAFVSSVAGNTVNLTRGQMWPAKTHASGVRIAPTATGWANAIEMNIAEGTGAWACPAVDVGHGAETFNGWLARRCKALYDALDFDGVFIDVFGWYSVNIANVDGNRNNTADTTAEKTAWVALTQAGMAKQAIDTRASLGPAALVVTNGTTYSADFNGQVFEGWPGKTWALSDWNDYFGGNGNPPSYASYPYSLANGATPKLSTVIGIGGVAYSGTNGTANFTTADWAYVRYSLGTALLQDGFYAYDDSTSGYFTDMWWFDEYDNGGAGQGYLGKPLAAAYKLPTTDPGGGLPYSNTANTWCRVYANGIVFVNPNVSAVTVTMGKPYTKITGRANYSDTTVNNGANVTSVTLAARDGIVLLNATPQATDSYPESNLDSNRVLYTGTYVGAGQSFTSAVGGTLDSIVFCMARLGSPVGTMQASLYSHQGTYGTTSSVTSLLASSKTPMDVSQLVSTSVGDSLVKFSFDNTVTLTQGTQYVALVQFTSSFSDASNNIVVGRDGTTPTHDGNMLMVNTAGTVSAGATTPDATRDAIFYVYVIAA